MFDSSKLIQKNHIGSEALSSNLTKVEDESSRQLTVDSQDNDDERCWADAKSEFTEDYDYDLGTTFNSNPLYQNDSSQIEKTKLDEISDEFDYLILHKAIFHNDTTLALSILADTELLQQKDLVNRKDKHGNTALHLACMLGRSKEIISAFLDNTKVKWSIDVKNLSRWSPFHEALSYGNREVITLLTKQIKDDVDDYLHNKKLSDFLKKTKNYRIVVKWEFQSWVPFIARVLPSDICVIHKQGENLRVDTRLLDFERLFRKKGHSCMVYSEGRWIVMNNKLKKYQYLEVPNVCKDIDERVDEFMSMDIMDFELVSAEMQLTRSTSGWIWKADRKVKVGRFNAALYDFNNVYLVTRKRREHLSDEDLKRNKMTYKNAVHAFKFGERPPPPSISDDEISDNSQNDHSRIDEEESVYHRESLSPPPPTNVTWAQYIGADPGHHPCLGREQKLKTTKTAVRASVSMSNEFPITKNELLDLLSVVPIKMFKKLKEFVEMKLPDGFPVCLNIPVFPALSTKISFEDFTFVEESLVDDSLFKIPPDYEQDTNLLPKRFCATGGDDENVDEPSGNNEG